MQRVGEQKKRLTTRCNGQCVGLCISSTDSGPRRRENSEFNAAVQNFWSDRQISVIEFARSLEGYYVLCRIKHCRIMDFGGLACKLKLPVESAALFLQTPVKFRLERSCLAHLVCVWVSLASTDLCGSPKRW